MIKEELLKGFEVVLDEDNVITEDKEPNLLIAENSLIFENFYKEIT